MPTEFGSSDPGFGIFADTVTSGSAAAMICPGRGVMSSMRMEPAPRRWRKVAKSIRLSTANRFIRSGSLPDFTEPVSHVRPPS